MAIKLRSISFVPALRVIAVLITLTGTLFAYYGLVGWPNFQYAFQPEAYADSLEEGHNLQSGFHWAITLWDNHDKQDEWPFRLALESLSSPYPYLYYVDGTGRESIKNIGEVPDVETFFSGLPTHQKFTLSDGRTVYVGLAPATYHALAERYATKRASGTTGLYLITAGFVAAMLGAGYVMYSAGQQSNSTEIQLSFLDRLYLDVGLVIFLGAFSVGLIGGAALWTIFNRGGPQISLVLAALLAVIITLVGLQYLSTVAKRLKRGEFFKHTLIYASIARVIKAGPLAARASGLLLAYGVAISVSLSLRSSLLFGLVIIVAIMYVVNRALEFKAIINGIERIKGGDLSYRIPERGATDFAALASNINNIALGLQAAVESEVKSERMKAELVTNVSHDLKTPLTSIITYVDLLKTEGLSSENAPKYLDVLDKKSQRLKVLTEDLFEAAKAASGTLSIKRETLDVGALLTQGLAELSDRIEGSGLDFRVNLPLGRLEVQADGKLLWRAIENVLSNILNYALVGSRVYVDATARGNQVYLTFKNISASPLNIAPEELVERFKRGDESRSTEGSGLGLAIAKSLVELQGGTFKIEIDGDLFKVTMTLLEYK
ncbi:MAG: signal transduction histidine kinase [Bacillota bacterium]|nr:MAG: signal transduction histidine kinase [Bacillota bacterium]